MKFACAGPCINAYGHQLKESASNAATTALAACSVVVFDTSNFDVNSPYIAVANTTSASDKLRCGVVDEQGIAASSDGEIIIKGIARVLKYAETWAVGDKVVSYTSGGKAAKQAVATAGYAGCIIGTCIVAQTTTTDTYGYISVNLE
jgi:hypothetical protein